MWIYDIRPKLLKCSHNFCLSSPLQQYLPIKKEVWYKEYIMRRKKYFVSWLRCEPFLFWQFPSQASTAYMYLQTQKKLMNCANDRNGGNRKEMAVHNLGSLIKTVWAPVRGFLQVSLGNLTWLYYKVLVRNGWLFFSLIWDQTTVIRILPSLDNTIKLIAVISCLIFMKMNEWNWLNCSTVCSTILVFSTTSRSKIFLREAAIYAPTWWRWKWWVRGYVTSNLVYGINAHVQF